PLGITSMLDAPLRLSGRPGGVLCHEHVGEPRDWTPGEQVFAMAVANLLSLVEEQSERREATLALRQSEERVRSLIEAAAAIVCTAPASGEFETPQYGWTRFTGQTYDELKGWGWLNAVPPDDRPNTAKVWAAAVAGRTLYQVEHRLHRADGVYRHMAVRAVP